MGLLFIAYAFGLGIGLAAFERGRSRSSGSPPAMTLFVLLVAIAFGAVTAGALLLHGASRPEGRLSSVALIAGGASYLLGLAISNRTGLALRLVGFALIFGVALVPSNLTFLLPIFALLAVGLIGPSPRRQPVGASNID